MHHTEIARMVADQIGPGRRFKSASALSRAAGFNKNTASNIMSSGHGDIETIARIADVLEVPRIEAFRMAGWLRDEDMPIDQLTPTTRELLILFERSSENVRRFILKGIRSG